MATNLISSPGVVGRHHFLREVDSDTLRCVRCKSLLKSENCLQCLDYITHPRHRSCTTSIIKKSHGSLLLGALLVAVILIVDPLYTDEVSSCFNVPRNLSCSLLVLGIILRGLVAVITLSAYTNCECHSQSSTCRWISQGLKNHLPEEGLLTSKALVEWVNWKYARVGYLLEVRLVEVSLVIVRHDGNWLCCLSFRGLLRRFFVSSSLIIRMHIYSQDWHEKKTVLSSTFFSLD